MTAIYHITHVGNLPSVLACGGLYCDADREKRCPDAVSIAHAHIKDRRARKGVPVAARGALCDYVPFYFANRSPMLYAIHTGSVQGYTGGQASVRFTWFRRSNGCLPEIGRGVSRTATPSNR